MFYNYGGGMSFNSPLTFTDTSSVVGVSIWFKFDYKL